MKEYPDIYYQLKSCIEAFECINRGNEEAIFWRELFLKDKKVSPIVRALFTYIPSSEFIKNSPEENLKRCLTIEKNQ